jgi:predicted RNA-binding Zn-ribbon protein involved in translation (DUF1610 family)
MISQDDDDWLPTSSNALVCARCNQAMTPGEVTVTYLGFTFPVELVRCPTCGDAHISEELATGKMLEVEQLLEDK